jgi:hypothetical protein
VGSLSVVVRLLVLGLAGGGVAAGCGGQTTTDSDGATLCPDLCTKGRPCPSAPAITTTCDDFCLGEDYRATQTGCHDLYDAAEVCLSKLDDICTGPKDCAAEINATSNCEIAYCTKHPTNDACVVPTQ